MKLQSNINAVYRLFIRVDRLITMFRLKSMLRCVPKCGICCIKTDIEATILEFLPAANQLYISGNYIAVLDMIDKQESEICIFFNPFSESGNCNNYNYRGLICRLFGFAVNKDKNGSNTLVTCKSIKNTLDFYLLKKQILSEAPNIAACYMKLFTIAPELAIKTLPINEAIKKAIEMVVLHYQYRKKPALYLQKTMFFT